jgi:hypothetical protein
MLAGRAPENLALAAFVVAVFDPCRGRSEEGRQLIFAFE